MYNFRIIEENTYYFITNNKTEYNIRFKNSPYVFGEEAIFSSYVFELINEAVAKAPSEGTDEIIPLTIHAIFLDFYKRIMKTIYACISVNHRMAGRKREPENF